MNDARRRTTRFAAFAGLASAGLTLVGVLIPGKGPSSVEGASPTAVAGYFEAHASAIEAGNYFLALGAAAFLIFLAGLRATLSDAEEGTGPLATLAFAAGAVGVCLQLAGVAVWTALAERAGQPVDFNLATAMSDTGAAVSGFAWFGFAVAFALTAHLTLSFRVLPTWVGWLSAGLTPLALASAPVPGSGLDNVTTIGMLVWTVAIAVTQLRRPRRR